MSFSTPVDVSACTTATQARVAVLAAGRRAGAAGRARGPTPRRRARRRHRSGARTSHMRSPNTPLTPTITVSPGSTRLTKHASMPAEPVPLIGNVSAFSVRKTVRRRAMISSRIARNSGSRCPSIGRASAATTSGYGFDGPGPSSRRSVMGMRGSLRARGTSRLGGVSGAREDGEPVLEELAHLEQAVVARGDAARDLGGGARRRA